MPMDISDFQLGKVITAIFKGPPGSGKTVAAASFPKPYFISTDGKIASIKQFYPKGNKYGPISYDITTNYWDTHQLIEPLQKSCPHETIIVDGLTKLSLFAIQHSIDYREEERGAGMTPQKKKEKEDMVKGLKRGELLLPEIEDYKAETQGLYQIIFKLKDLSARFGVHTILTAHVLDIEYESLTGKVKKIQSLLTGGKKVAAMIPGEYDEIYHFGMDKAVDGGVLGYFVKTRDDGDNFARTALPIPAKIEITNRTDFYDRLQLAIKNSI